MREYKTRIQALKYCKKNNIPYENIKRAKKYITTKRTWNDLEYRTVVRESFVYRVW